MAGAPPRSGENKKSAYEDRSPHGASADYSRVALTYESSRTSNSRSRLSYQYGGAPVKASQHPHKGQQPDPLTGVRLLRGFESPDWPSIGRGFLRRATDVRGLEPLGSPADLELDPIPLGQALEPLSLDGAEVHEH